MKPFVRIEDDMPWNQKLRPLKPDAKWSYVASICYCGHFLTDGFLPEHDLAFVGASRRVAKALEIAELWEPRPGGWYVHDYLKHNRSKADVEALISSRSHAGKLGKLAQQKSRQMLGQMPSDLPKANDVASDLSVSVSASPHLIDPSEIPQKKQSGHLPRHLPGTDPVLANVIESLGRFNIDVRGMQAERIMMLLDDGAKPEWFGAAATIAADKDVRDVAYVNKIVERWLAAGGPPQQNQRRNHRPEAARDEYAVALDRIAGAMP